MSKMKNQFSGERIFLIGNGPSLHETPLHELESEYTFGMNKISLIYNEISWQPTFYQYITPPTHPGTPSVSDNNNFIEKNIHSDSICFIHSDWKEIYGEKKNVKYLNRSNKSSDKLNNLTIDEVRNINVQRLLNIWSEAVDQVVYSYHSMYPALQIASFLGFDEIYLIGCDLGMQYQNPHMIFEDGLDPYRWDADEQHCTYLPDLFARNTETKMTYTCDAISKGVLLESLGNALVYKFIQGDYNYINKLCSFLWPSPSSEHFSSQYYDLVRIHDGKKVEKQIIKGHIVANRISDLRDFNIYNSTVGGKLEVYERENLTSIV